jgi:glutamyl-tRNA reductase
MNLQVLYCNHQSADLDVRSRLAFAPGDLPRAYETLRSRFPHSEVVLLSTCNRVELYTAQQQAERLPSHQALSEFLAEFHQLSIERFAGTLFERTGPDAVRHLFQVAASLDSMVLGEPQIVAQVKEAYTFAQQQASTGPLTHSLFQRALGVSKRIRTETNLVNGRTSIASVAVGDFGKNIFQSFDDKTVLVIGAGEMAEETLRYLKDEGARRIVVVNRTLERAETLARDWGGEARSLEALDDALVDADVIVATTGVRLVDTAKFREVRRRSGTKPVFILDLGVPRDFPPEVRDLDDNVFLYTIEAALKIVDEETDRFFAELNHRATGPIIRRLRDQWREVVEQETARLFQKLPHLEKDRKEIEKTIEQMVNKLLHPPLEALRDESREGTPHGLLDALRRLFRL